MQNEIVKSVVLTKNKNLYKEEICEGRRENKKKRKGRKQKEKIPNQRGGESKKERKFPDQRLKKKRRKFSIKDRKKTEEICRKVFGPDNI